MSITVIMSIAANLASSAAPDARIERISRSTCDLSSDRLVQCAPPDATIEGELTETAVPLRSELVRTLSGNCSTPFPLTVRVIGDGVRLDSYSYLQRESKIVRAWDRGVLSELQMMEASYWSAYASYDSSCQIGIDIYMNRPDVDSTAEAQSILASLRRTLNEKDAAAKSAEQLLLLNQAYGFMSSVANLFHRELTSDEVQELRSASVESNATLMNAIVSCDSGLSIDQKQQLFRLSVALGALDHPDVWENPDGTRKSISDFVGPDAADVLAAVDEFAANGDPLVLEQLTVDAEQAAAHAAEAQAAVSLAETQLAEWL